MESGEARASQTEQTKYRTLKGAHRWVFLVFSGAALGLAITWLFHLGAVQILELSFMGLLLALLVPLVFLLIPATSGNRRDRIPWYDYLLALAAFVSPFWVFTAGTDIINKGWAVVPPPIAVVLGSIFWVVILEGSRRAVGLVFTTAVLVFSAYPLFSASMPGFLMGKSFSFPDTVAFHYLSIDSIFGLPMHTLGRLVIGFMVFAVALQVTGGGKFFISFAMALLGHVRGGPAKVSIVASALFGTLSGSVIANVATTGPITIPAMKRAGYPAAYAGAVEACASTGGVLMPPVMGITAFIMAEFLGVPYRTVCIAAAIPSALYYLSLFVQTDFFAARAGLKGLPRKELPLWWQPLKEGWIYIFALLLLIFLVVVLMLESRAPYYTAVALLITAMFRKETRIKLSTLVKFVEQTGKLLCELSVIMGAVGLIVGGLTLPGTAAAFSRGMIDLAGNNLFLLVGMTAIASAILGMGTSISAVYIFLAIVVGPPLIQFGLNPIAVHLFILYWAMSSYITPPVAVGAYTAAALARAKPAATAWRSCRLGIAAYIVPFLFIFQPELLFQSTSLLMIIPSIARVAVGIGLICATIEGYLLGLGRIGILTRVLLGISGVLVASPGWIINLIGLGMAGVLVLGLLTRKHLVPQSA